MRDAIYDPPGRRIQTMLRGQLLEERIKLLDSRSAFQPYFS